MKPIDLVSLGREVLKDEIEGLRSLEPMITSPEWARAVELCLGRRGRILVSGVGKSGLVAQRIAASLRSTGTPSVFLHPTDALHGDLGLVDPADVGLFLSKSGETPELLQLAPLFHRISVPFVAIVGEARSQLGLVADVALTLGPLREAGPLRSVPTTSALVFQAVGDLLVTSLYASRGFGEGDLAFLHPGGLIGQNVTRRVSDAMRAGARVPRVAPEASLRAAIVEIIEKKLGMTTVVDADGVLVGILTDGDLRRAMHRHDRVDGLRVAEVMTRDPRTIEAEAFLAAAVERMENNERGPITCLVVADAQRRPVGVLHLHDCLRLVSAAAPVATGAAPPVVR